MIVLITGASHTGKTALAQKLLEKYKYPYFSIDHLKMGLIRSGYTEFTPMSDDRELTKYHFSDIKRYADVIEKRIDDEWCTLETVLADNAQMLADAEKHKANYVLIDDEYEIDIDL